MTQAQRSKYKLVTWCDFLDELVFKDHYKLNTNLKGKRSCLKSLNHKYLVPGALKMIFHLNTRYMAGVVMAVSFFPQMKEQNVFYFSL